MDLPITSSAAAASSSTIATSVTCISRPSASAVPRRSMTPATPAHPIATSVTPRRHVRPNVSETITATSTPNRCRKPSRIRRADRSESTGRRAAHPFSTFERSIPAFAQTKPCSVSLMMRSPLRRRMRTDSRSTSGLWLSGSVGSIATRRSSAFETIFWVTTTTSPSASEVSGELDAASWMIAARSSPARISPIPSMPKISIRLMRSLQKAPFGQATQTRRVCS